MITQTTDDSHLSPDHAELNAIRQAALDAFQRAARLAASLPDMATQEVFSQLSGVNTEAIDPTEIQQLVDEIATAAVRVHNTLGRPLPDELEAWSRQPTPAAESAVPRRRTVAESAVCAGTPDSVCEWRFQTADSVLQAVRSQLTEGGELSPEDQAILDELQERVTDRRAKRTTAAESAVRRPVDDVQPRGLRRPQGLHSLKETDAILEQLGCRAAGPEI